MMWEALKKSINGLVNKVNVSNIQNIVLELFQENLVRGKGAVPLGARTRSSRYSRVGYTLRGRAHWPTLGTRLCFAEPCNCNPNIFT